MQHVAAVGPMLQRTLSPGIHSCGFRTHPARYDNLGDRALSRPAEEFLIASRLRRWDRETVLSMTYYFQDSSMLAASLADRPAADGQTSQALPEGPRIEEGFTDVVARRRSQRAYRATPVSLGELATVLRHAGSVTAAAEADLLEGGSVQLHWRAVPSAGGLYPVSVWIGVLRVDGLTPGLYRFVPSEDVLVPAADEATLQQLLTGFDTQGGPVDLGQAAFVVLLIGQPWRSMRKYGPRGMRFLFHEAGGIAQNVHNAATGLALGSLDFSGFYDDECNVTLGLDGLSELLLHAVIVGVPA